MDKGSITISQGGISNSKIAQMFEHPSKMLSVTTPERITAYKRLYQYLVELQGSGKISVHHDYLSGNDLAINIYKKKYYLKDLDTTTIEDKPEDVFVRLASFMAAMESTEEKQNLWAEKFYNDLYHGHFLPGGRVIAGAGDLYRLKTLANCFVSVIDGDNIESIYKAAYECARTYSYGGGIGVDISVLRPKGSVVHNAADNSTGSVSFMEIYSLTTGLIGQSGRRGALMLTLDVKHPDVMDFINAKKVPNWVTKQIIEQCAWSGTFDEKQLKVIESQVRENTQVRFANISLKVSDEFMQAVEEQKKFGPDSYVLYKKKNKAVISGARQSTDIHYSYGIPSRAIEDYEFIGNYASVQEVSKELNLKYRVAVDAATLSDTTKRDMFGDYVISPPGKEYDLTVRRAGDFLLYFNSKQTGEIKKLVKARDVWNTFVEGNYRTAEPGLIFWTSMTKFSPSNYVGKPIASTNPCVAADSLISTELGLQRIDNVRAERIVVDVRTLDGDGLLSLGTLRVKPSQIVKTGIKPCMKLITYSGYELVATPDHKILTTTGWKELGYLTSNDLVCVQPNNKCSSFEDRVASITNVGHHEVWDITEPQTHSFIANGIVVHNCGEVPLEDGGACNLGSINLSRFVSKGYTANAAIDWSALKLSAHLVTRFLDNVVSWNENLNPLEKQRVAASETRRLGIGIMGVADMFNQLGVNYDSPQGLVLLEKVSAFIANEAYQASALLAKEKAPSPIWDYTKYARGAFFQQNLSAQTQAMIKENGLRNIAILSIAPTGTISNVILGYSYGDKNYIGVSGGIEPVFALFYTRRSESFGNKFFNVFHSTVQAFIDLKNLSDDVIHATKEEELRGKLPDYFFRTAHHIDPQMRVKIQGLVQKYIDHSISSTVNLPEDIEPETISNIYLNAWREGLKGITIYRDGSRYPILSVEGKRTEFQDLKEKTFTIIENGKTIQATGDTVLTLPDGTLTTVYHKLKAGTLSHANDPVLAPMKKKEQHSEPVDDSKLLKCPACSKMTYRNDGGCATCIDPECGFGKCDS